MQASNKSQTFKLTAPIIQMVSVESLGEKIELHIKRDDLLHPIISGNKWRKLKYLLIDARQKGCSSLVSMGGNWSNHLHALAYAGKQLGFSTIGFVRAHPEQPLTPTLEDCQRWGMQLIFCSREDYAQLRSSFQWDHFAGQFTGSYWISEGGFSELAIQGVTEMAQEITEHYDHIFVGVGSGATLAGLVKAFPDSMVTGVAAFAGAEYLIEQLTPYLQPQTNWRLDTEHHCGGFAKVNQRLEQLVREFAEQTQIELDLLYNGKCLLALVEAAKQGTIEPGQKVLMLHTGGLQGNRSRRHR